MIGFIAVELFRRLPASLRIHKRDEKRGVHLELQDLVWLQS